MFISGTVYGEPLPRKQEDIIKLVIDEVFKKFRPMVQPQRYRVTCTPLSDRYRMNECPKLVVEIRVQAGDDYEMYEDYNHEVCVVVLLLCVCVWVWVWVGGAWCMHM